MKISELIAALEAIKAEKGDLQVNPVISQVYSEIRSIEVTGTRVYLLEH